MALFGAAKVRDVVTLAIETNELRFLTTKEQRVEKWGSVPLPSGLVAEGLILNAMEMGMIIDELFEREELDRKYVITSLCGLRSIPRFLRLPKLRPSLLADAISREARKEMPISLENLYLSWQAMPGAGDRQTIYLLGVPRELVDAQIRALEAANVRVFVMDLKPLALIRATRQSEAIIVDLEQDVLDIVLVNNYLPTIMRTFSLGNEFLNDQGRLDRLLSELDQTLRFYNDSHRKSPIGPITPVFLMGKVLNSHDAVDYLKRATDRPLEPPMPSIPSPGDMPVPEYMTNLGLALKKV
jgi:Tfp pilus assembly PilM family ATPase